MKNNLELALRISHDLIAYCHRHGATEYEMKISEGKESMLYMIQASPVEISDEQMEILVKNLKAPRQAELENDYWELIGESEDYSELMLAGISCDEADIEYRNNAITFTLLRHNY